MKLSTKGTAYVGLLLVALVMAGIAIVRQFTVEDTKNDLANQVTNACRNDRVGAEARGLNCAQAENETTSPNPNPITVTAPPSILQVPLPTVITATQQVPLPFPTVETIQLPGERTVERNNNTQTVTKTETSVSTTVSTPPPEVTTTTTTFYEPTTTTVYRPCQVVDVPDDIPKCPEGE